MADLYGNGVALSEKVLDYLWGRQNVTLNNIANNDTPGFKAQYVSFEEELAKKINIAKNQKNSMASIGKAIDSTYASLRTTSTESTRLDGNNVDMDQEQVELVRTTLEYQYMVNSINNELNRLMSAVKSF